MLADDIQPFLEQIKRREITNREVAARLHVSESHLCRVLKQLGVERDPPPDRKAQAELNRARRAFRENAARTLSVPAAARAAGCSVRTIYRLKAKLK